MMRIKITAKPSVSREQIVRVAVARIGEITLVIFAVLFLLGLYIFWKYAWTLTGFEGQPTIVLPTIPKQRLSGTIEYIDQKELDFKSPLPPLSAPDPFQHSVSGEQ